MTHFDTDVLVVGLGPMGATTTLALARAGVRVHAISKRSWVADTPRAHITNIRAAEVLRSLGVEQECLAQATPWGSMGDTLFTTSLAGPEIARLRTWGTGDERSGEYRLSSPSAMMDIPQVYLEPILVNAAGRAGASIAFQSEYLGHEQDADGVTVRIRDRVTGTSSLLRARYLVGADGAKSRVAEDAGLPLEGVLARAGTVYVQFRADLSAYVAHRPSILYWIMNPAAGFGEIGMGLLRTIRPWNEWIAGWGFDMSLGDPDLSPENALQKIRALVGDPEFECEITGIFPWYVNRQYATELSRGRVFCGGDAVHRHPPSSGLGSNTSIQDGYNLAWKLAMVVRGDAGAELLDSYSAERAPVARQIVERANQSRVDYAPMREAFAVPGADEPVAAGLARLADGGAEGRAARAAMRAALDLKDYEFNALGTEMNQRYISGAVLDEDAGAEIWRADPALHAQNTSRPGAKIPHTWLVGPDGRRVSTLDVIDDDRLTLVTDHAGTAWVEGVRASGTDVRVVVVGAPEYQDLYFAWHRVSELEDGGALLVRPDRVVAWRHVTAIDDADAATALLERAVVSVLHTAPAALKELSR